MEIPQKKSDYFLYVLQSLRADEMVALYGEFIPVKNEDDRINAFLKLQFLKEQKEYPNGNFSFDQQAAYWAAKLIFYSSQLMLNREGDVEEITKNIEDFEETVNLNRSLSADLTLRFLPKIIEQLQEIDIDDPLIELLNKIIHKWHYSGISFMKDAEKLDFKPLETDALFLQMYAERVVLLNNKILMKVELIDEFLARELGDYIDELV